MPKFKYVAVGADGTQVKATAESPSAVSLENDLRVQGMRDVKVKERKSLTEIEITKQKVPRTDVMHFSRQLAAFVRTGIPLTEAIRVVRDGASNKRFRAILGDVEEALQSGTPFSEALALHREVFPAYYLGILRSAELTGQLDVVLDQLSIYIERDLEARSKVKSALTYPMVVLAMAIATVAILMIFVLPKFVVFFEDMDSELPLPTRMLLGLADFTSSPLGLGVAGLVVVIGLVLYFWGKQPSGRRARHSLMMKLPLVGDIVRFGATERFCRVIAAMMRSGVPLPEAMNSAMESVNNAVFEEALVVAREQMIQGDGIAGPIALTGVFPTAAVQMIRVGEETGTLDQQIDSAAAYYGRELEYKVKRLTTLFEPAVILFMGLVVGFVAVALVSAMYGVLDGTEVS